MIAHTSVVRPAIESAKPGTSSRGAAGSFDSGTSQLAGGERGDDEREVDEEDRVPARVLDQEAARDRADGDAEAGDAGPHADRLGAFTGGKDGGDDRQRRGHDERAADAHEGAGGDQHLRRGRERGETRAEAEDGQADGEAAFAAEAVAEGAGGEEQAGEDEHVRVDDPLQLGARLRRGRSRSVGSATLRMVLSSPITSSDAERTTSVHQRRGSGTSSVRSGTEASWRGEGGGEEE